MKWIKAAKKLIWDKYWASYSGINPSIWFLLLVILINRVGSTTVFFLSLYFKNILNFNLSYIGILLGLYGLGCFVGNILSGILSDYLRPISILVFSFVLSALLYVGLSIPTSYLVISAILIFLGIAVSVGQPSTSVILGNLVSENNRLKVFSLYRVINNIGVSIAGVIGGFVASLSFKAIFYIDGLTAFLAGIALVLFIYKGDVLSKDNNKQTSVENASQSFISVLSDNYFISICAMVVCMLVVFMQVTSIYPIYLQQAYSLDTNRIGFLFALNGLLIAIFQVPLTKLSDKLDITYLAILGTILLGVGLGTLPFGSSFLFALVSCVIWTLGEMLFFPSNTTLAFNHIKTNKGKYMAVYEAAISGSRLVFPFLGALIYQYLGMNVVWYLGFVCALLVSIGYFRIDKIVKSQHSLSIKPANIIE
jgi:predicted MFS family arabinose efflux permease